MRKAMPKIDMKALNRKQISIYKMMKRTVVLSLVAFVATACSQSGKSAKSYLQAAQTAYENENYEAAKLHIDSIKIANPKAFKEINAGFELMQKIRLAENKRNIYFCDSLIALKISAIEKLTTQFDYVRDKRYEEFGKYVSKNYPLSVSDNQNTLRAAVNEKGALYLESVLIGQPIHHTRVKVSAADGSYAETKDVTADGLNYRFRTLHNTHEVVRYISTEENNVAQFIFTYQNEPLTLTFFGKRNFSVSLSKAAKESIARTFELSHLQNELKELEFQKEKSEALIRYLRSKENTSRSQQ